MNTYAPLTFTELVDLVEGRLTPAEQAEVRARLQHDPQAAADLAWLERVIGVMRTDDSVDPPLFAVRNAVRLFERRATEPKPSLVQRIVAALQLDSAQTPMAVGVRSGQPVARQMLFSAEPYDVDLRITPRGDAWQVAGQVLGPCEGGRVLLQSDLDTVEAPLNELCEFALPPVPAGPYLLALRLAGAEIAIDTLNVGT